MGQIGVHEHVGHQLMQVKISALPEVESEMREHPISDAGGKNRLRHKKQDVQNNYVLDHRGC